LSVTHFEAPWNLLEGMKFISAKSSRYRTPKDDFDGGEESIRFATKPGFNIEAMHLPSEAERPARSRQLHFTQ
jgi:hypothetical protein